MIDEELMKKFMEALEEKMKPQMEEITGAIRDSVLKSVQEHTKIMEERTQQLEAWFISKMIVIEYLITELQKKDLLPADDAIAFELEKLGKEYRDKVKSKMDKDLETANGTKEDSTKDNN
jgi:hypothetical protein